MSNAATRTALVLRDPSVSNSITIRVGSLPALTDSTLYRSMNFLQVLQSLASSRVSSRSEEHTSELQSPCNLVCRLLLEKKNTGDMQPYYRNACDRPFITFNKAGATAFVRG